MQSLEIYLDRAHTSKTPLALVGDPGSGKTTRIENWARKKNLKLIKLLASSMDETDAAGIIIEKDGQATTCPPSWFFELQKAGGGVLFLDELNTARREVQDALLTIVASRAMPSGESLENVLIIAAMNDYRQIDAYEPSPAMRNRFGWIDYHLSEHQWLSWAQKQGFEGVEIIAEAIKDGLKFSRGNDFLEDQNRFTTARSLTNLLEFSENGKEIQLFAANFVDAKSAQIIESVILKDANINSNAFFARKKDRQEDERVYETVSLTQKINKINGK